MGSGEHMNRNEIIHSFLLWTFFTSKFLPSFSSAMFGWREVKVGGSSGLGEFLPIFSSPSSGGEHRPLLKRKIYYLQGPLSLREWIQTGEVGSTSSLPNTVECPHLVGNPKHALSPHPGITVAHTGQTHNYFLVTWLLYFIKKFLGEGVMYHGFYRLQP